MALLLIFALAIVSFLQGNALSTGVDYSNSVEEFMTYVRSAAPTVEVVVEQAHGGVQKVLSELHLTEESVLTELHPELTWYRSHMIYLMSKPENVLTLYVLLSTMGDSLISDPNMNSIDSPEEEYVCSDDNVKLWYSRRPCTDENLFDMYLSDKVSQLKAVFYQLSDALKDETRLPAPHEFVAYDNSLPKPHEFLPLSMYSHAHHDVAFAPSVKKGCVRRLQDLVEEGCFDIETLPTLYDTVIPTDIAYFFLKMSLPSWNLTDISAHRGDGKMTKPQCSEYIIEFVTSMCGSVLSLEHFTPPEFHEGASFPKLPGEHHHPGDHLHHSNLMDMRGLHAHHGTDDSVPLPKQDKTTYTETKRKHVPPTAHPKSAHLKKEEHSKEAKASIQKRQLGLFQQASQGILRI